MTSSKFRVDALPSGVFELLASFLTGFDLLRLSHVNQRLLTELLARDAPEWQRRVPSSGAYKTAKERYCLSRSLAFPGRGTPNKLANERGGAVEVWNSGIPDYWISGSFSLDLWFALLPGDTDPRMGVHFGGIILGAQSCAWSHNWWPGYHQQFIHVDTSGNLYCSVFNTKTVVAESLQPHRWYHLAMTVEKAQLGVDATQCVYLNGELAHTLVGQLHSESDHLYWAQLGSGCISGGSVGKLTEDFTGWYSFNGVLDTCRLWRGVLHPDQVRRAAHGDSPVVTSDSSLVLSKQLDPRIMEARGPVWRVRCTRPLERIYSELHGLY